jgi:hypothetical protein
MLTNISAEKLAFIFNTEMKFKLEMNAEGKLWVMGMLGQQVLLQRQ